MILDDGAHTAILMSADLCFHDLHLLDRIKAFARAEFGVQEDSVFLSYTHTHSGPSVLSYDYGFHSDAYEEFLFSRCADCLRKAFAGMFEGEMAQTVTTGRWNMNRRRGGRQDHAAPNPRSYGYGMPCTSSTTNRAECAP